MLYYMINAAYKDETWGEKETNEKKEIYIDLAAESAVFNGKAVSEYCFLLRQIEPDKITACAAVDRFTDVEAEAQKFFEHLGLQVSDIECKEVNSHSMIMMVRQSDNNKLCEDKYEIYEKYDIEDDYHFWKSEKMIVPSDKGRVEHVAKYNRAPKSYMEEIERIYQQPNIERRPAHPVHYIFGSDNVITTKKLVDNLLDALYQNKRIFSKKTVVVTRTDVDDDFSDEYRRCKGGAIVFYINEEVQEGSNASPYNRFLENTVPYIKKNRNDVLTIFVFPRECKRLKELLYNEMAYMSFVEIADELMDGKEAKNVLTDMAKEKNIQPDEKLTAIIDESSKYYLNEVTTVFEEWYSNISKTVIFPQYSSVEAIEKGDSKEKVKGDSYKELQSMIGLGEAKKVITGAVNYYKVQKLYQDKGMPQDRPSMHMCFTGNPGTAKTTVARLVADIMKQNGVLSSGHLVEVGRSDLVGKYVGWTAPTIQKKFKEAKGGVLFIDEAYSLVEDSEAGYGDEAINTIVQEMENNRDQLIVIFAGYPDEMKKFLEKNPGLKSRIAFHVPFEDYSTEELVDITRFMASKKEMELTDGAIAKLQSVYEEAIENDDFGNGRFVRNMLEKARMSQAERLASMDYEQIGKKELKTIIEDDIESWVPEKKVVRTIGFIA